MADIVLLVDRLQRRVQPSDESLQFSDTDFYQAIEDAVMEMTGQLSVEDVQPTDELPVLYQAMSSCYYTLASKTAENMRFKIQNDEYFGYQVHQQYLSLAEKFKGMAEESRGIQVHTVTRTQTGTGRKAPYYLGDKP